jgi:putative membrane protein
VRSFKKIGAKKLMTELRDILIRLVANGLAIIATASILPGFHVKESDRALTFLLLAVVFGLVNGLVKPVAKVLSCPLTCLTLGLFALILNALLLGLSSWIANKIVPDALIIDGFWWALFGAIIMGIVHSILEWISKQLFPEDEGSK